VRASPTGAGPPAADDPPVDAAALGRELARLDSAEPGGPVDLAELAAAAVATVARLAERAGSAVTLRRPAEPLLAVGSPTVLRQAILDGLVCALRRSGSGPIAVELAAAAGAARLTIRTAAGSAGADEPELAEMRQLLATQGGALDRRRGADGWSLTLAVPVGQPPTVLVVDDSDDIRQLFRRYLSGTSYRVAEARCGDEGLDLVGRLRPACLILDVMMPSRDGWEVLQLLRAQPSTADTPVIICTVLRQRELALSLGATGYLAKPVAREALLAALHDATAARPTLTAAR
jgi:CheY-like chemotaxis protein